MLRRIDELIRQKTDFAIETTLSTKSYAQTIKKAKENNYSVTLVYFWLNSPELAIERVKIRVSEGGHNIPEDVIRRRYKRGIENLFKIFIPIADYWLILDNSQNPFLFIAEGWEEIGNTIYNEEIWNKLQSLRHE